MNLAKLREPFPETDVEWRIQRSGFKSGKPWALVLAYVTNRAIQQRLDDICGPQSWQNKYDQAPSGEGVLCGIGIKIDLEWVWKWDGAENTQFEAVKGGLSGSMKRAAVQWGIGRYLYDLTAGFADFTDDGRYRDKVKDESTGQEKWLKWNPPRLPAWAVNGNSPPPSQPAPDDDQEFKKEDALFLRDMLLSYLLKVEAVVGKDRTDKMRAAVEKNEKNEEVVGKWKRFADWITAAHETIKAEVAANTGGIHPVFAGAVEEVKNPMAAAVGKLAQAAKESGKVPTEAKQGGLPYDHD